MVTLEAKTQFIMASNGSLCKPFSHQVHLGNGN